MFCSTWNNFIKIPERNVRASNQIRKTFRFRKMCGAYLLQIRIHLSRTKVFLAGKTIQLGDLFIFPASIIQTEIIRQAQLPGLLRQTQICIILPEKDPVFRTGGKHPIRLIDALRNQIVNQNPDIRLITTKDERIFLLNLQVRIDARHQTLGSGFLITRRTVDLSCQEQVLNTFRFQGRLQENRIKVIILNCIRRLIDHYVLKTRNGAQRFDLDIQRKRRRKTLQVILEGILAFRLQEKLVRVLISKSPELILDARTIPRTPSMDQSVEKGRVFESGTKDVMNLFVSMEDIAGHLVLPQLCSGRTRQEREAVRRSIAFLLDRPGQIDRPDIDPRRRTGLHTLRRNPHRSELFGQAV